MLPNLQSWVEAAPEKGVIVVEYYWQPPPGQTLAPDRSGSKTSFVYFKRMLVADKCWCGSNRQFGRCHRRSADWSYVTPDPDLRAWSPVVLIHQAFHLRDDPPAVFITEERSDLLPIQMRPGRRVWAIPLRPRSENEIGIPVLGTFEIGDRELHVETNSEKRLEEIKQLLKELFGDGIEEGTVRRSEPQEAFLPPARRKKR